MKRTVEITMDVNVARKVLRDVALHPGTDALTEDEVLQKVLKKLACYGVTAKIANNCTETK